MISVDGVIVVVCPSGNVVVIGVVISDDRVTAPFISEMTVRPAELTDVSYNEHMRSVHKLRMVIRFSI